MKLNIRFALKLKGTNFYKSEGQKKRLNYPPLDFSSKASMKRKGHLKYVKNCKIILYYFRTILLEQLFKARIG